MRLSFLWFVSDIIQGFFKCILDDHAVQNGQSVYSGIGLDCSIFPFLFELQKEFTKYQLQQAAALRSIYSWRLLEMFEQMKNKTDGSGWLSMPIEEFWHAMEATESYKSNFQLLRKRVIEPAIKELSEKDNWLIEWEARKRGRKVATLLFKFQRNPQGSLFNQDTAPLSKKRC